MPVPVVTRRPPDRTRRARALARSLVIDVRPLRQSRDFRLLVAGQTVSVLGSQMTAVAVPYQVYRLTGSSLDVGLVALAVLGPLLAGSLLGGSLVDATDRRRLLVVVSVAMAFVSAGLALNASARPTLWPLFVFPALAGGLGTFEDSALNTVVPNVVRRSDLPAANAIFQAVSQLGLVVGPAVAGVLLAGAGIWFAYWTDVATFGAATLAALAISPQPLAGGGQRPSLRSLLDGLRFVRGRQAIQGAFLIDLGATVFGLPRALFPAVAATLGGSAATLGLLYAAPGAGALIGALTTGWVGRVRRQGRAVTIAVVVWGLAIAGFGLTDSLPIALALLALAGWADVISSVFRSAIVQLAVPDELRGRLTGLQISVVTGGPRLGDLESGTVAAAIGVTASILSGGLACVASALVLTALLPGFRRLSTVE